MMKVLISSLAGLVAADCDGSPCQLLASPSLSRQAEPEVEADPVLTVNTFTAVDKCATEEVKDLTGWVLAYYEDVSNQLDISFSNILTTARLATSALHQLGGLSMELQAYQRVQNISTEMNAMLRTCLADAMHLSASMEKCDMAFSHEQYDMDSITTTEAKGIDSVWIKPEKIQANSTCLSAMCEHIIAWNDTCGDKGFLNDIKRIAAAHDLEGSKYAFASNRESTFHQPLHRLYTDGDSAADFAILNEDLFTQEAAVLSRMAMWIEIQFHAMMVLVRKALNGGQFAQASDMAVCGALGFPLNTVMWLSLAFEKCEGSMQKTWLKVSPMNNRFMHELVNALAEKIPNVFREGSPGVLFGGPLTNLCAHFNDYEKDITEEMEKLQAQHEAMNNVGGAPKIDTFYMNPVAKVGNPNDMRPFDKNLDGETQQIWMKNIASPLQ